MATRRSCRRALRHAEPRFRHPHARRDATGAAPRVELLDRFWMIATVKVVIDARVEYLQLTKAGPEWRVVAGLASADAPDEGDPPLDASGISAPAEDYAEGWYAADLARMSRALHPALFKQRSVHRPRNAVH